MNILLQIVEKTKTRIEAQKKAFPLTDAPKVEKPFAFEKALKAEGLSFICEVKKASPSKGVIAEDFPYIEIAKNYEKAGAAALSVLTEPDFFKGSANYLKEISEVVKVPILRKDFIIDEYQIYEAVNIGASAILLIAAILDFETLKRFLESANDKGLSALIETRNEREIETALKAGARLIGVNNRNLETFEVDCSTTAKLKKYVPDDVIFVAESGIKTRDDVLRLGEVDAVLIGETLMRSSDKKRVLDELRGL